MQQEPWAKAMIRIHSNPQIKSIDIVQLVLHLNHGPQCPSGVNRKRHAYFQDRLENSHCCGCILIDTTNTESIDIDFVYLLNSNQGGERL